MTKLNEANQLIEDLKSQGLTAQAIKDFLEDGQALAESGYTDEDQDMIEEAHDLVSREGV